MKISLIMSKTNHELIDVEKSDSVALSATY